MVTCGSGFRPYYARHETKEPKRPAGGGSLAVGSRLVEPRRTKSGVTSLAVAETVQREGWPLVQPPVERDPIVDFAAEADRFGVPLGPVENDARAGDVIRRVAEDALYLFGSIEAGVAYLSSKDIDGLGHTGLNLVAERGLPAVLMKLDELRFGFAG